MALKAKDIAEILGVSTATVSLVLNNKHGVGEQRRQEIINKIRELDCGYLLKEQRVNQGAIGFVVYKREGSIIDESPFFTYILEGINNSVSRCGYNLNPIYINKSMPLMEQEYQLKSGNYKGLIVFAVEMYYDDLQLFKDSGIPFTILDNSFQENDVDAVAINNVQGTSKAVAYLCAMGHEEIGYIRSYNLCREVKFMAIPKEKDGVFAEYCTHAASMTFKLPDNVSTLEGALMEPLAVGMHACELSNARLGERAVVLGAGCIGLVTLMALKARGVSEIYVVDVLDKRLAKAKELGAAKVFNSKTANIEAFVKTLPGGGVDQVYECAGNRSTTLQTCRLIKRAGKVTLVGVSPEPVLELDIATLNAMEGTIYSVYRYRNLYPSAINAVSSGLIPLKEIVSHTYDFEDIIKGVDYNLHHKDDVIKAVIKM